MIEGIKQFKEMEFEEVKKELRHKNLVHSFNNTI